MKFNLIITLFITILAYGCVSPQSFTVSKEELSEIKNKSNKASLIILYVYHKNCASCRKIEPVIEKLKSIYTGNEKILFLKYDLSSPFTIYKSRQVAKEIGIEDIYKSQRFSGIVLFVNPAKKETIDNLIAEYDVKKYIETINKYI